MKELIEIQNKLKAPKGQYNNFGKYKYRSCEDILESLKPLLYEQKCQLTIVDDIIMIGNRIYVKAIVTIKNEAGETEVTTAFAREEETKKGMDSSQVTGAASSYARKYALNGMFCIDDTKDSDATNVGEKKTSKAQNETPPYYDMAIQEIQSAQTIATLTAVYNNYQMLHTDANFMAALTAKKKELNAA